MANSVPACSCVLKGQVAPPAEGTPSPLSDHQEGQWEEDELSAINPPASSEASSVVTKLLVYFRLLFNLYFLGQPWFYLTFKINQVFVRSPKTHLLIPPFGGWSIQEKKKKKRWFQAFDFSDITLSWLCTLKELPNHVVMKEREPFTLALKKKKKNRCLFVCCPRRSGETVNDALGIGIFVFFCWGKFPFWQIQQERGRWSFKLRETF